jgi:hypothetical protein
MSSDPHDFPNSSHHDSNVAIHNERHVDAQSHLSAELNLAYTLSEPPYLVLR